jgi:hypothetical protein
MAKHTPYYSAAEVAEHNVMADCWVSFFGKVYDLTSLVEEHKGVLAQPILKHAGQDISNWFDPRSKEPKTYMHPELGIEVPFCPHGRYVHIPPDEPTADLETSTDLPWWRDLKYLVGKLSAKSRKIKIVNVLTKQEDLVNVCAEETCAEIRNRYLKYNSHALSYTWKRLGRCLDMNKTLEENGVKDESEEFAKLGMDPEEHIPALHIYFNDDLTVCSDCLT